MFGDFVGNNEPDATRRFAELFMDTHRRQVETDVYLARHQGLKAGVRPNVHPPLPEDEKFPPIKRLVFIEFPEKTMEWPFAETQVNTPWLDSFPQYDQ